MRETTLTLPVLNLIAITRVMLGAGLGLLLSDRLDPDRRRGAGWTLLLVGMATTLPLGIEALGRSRRR